MLKRWTSCLQSRPDTTVYRESCSKFACTTNILFRICLFTQLLSYACSPADCGDTTLPCPRRRLRLQCPRTSTHTPATGLGTCPCQTARQHNDGQGLVPQFHLAHSVIGYMAWSSPICSPRYKFVEGATPDKVLSTQTTKTQHNARLHALVHMLVLNFREFLTNIFKTSIQGCQLRGLHSLLNF